jgi:hypothetical protein
VTLVVTLVQVQDRANFARLDNTLLLAHLHARIVQLAVTLLQLAHRNARCVLLEPTLLQLAPHLAALV